VVDLPVSSFDLARPGVASPLMMNDDNWMKRLITECSTSTRGCLNPLNPPVDLPCSHTAIT